MKEKKGKKRGKGNIKGTGIGNQIKLIFLLGLVQIIHLFLSFVLISVG